MNIVLTGFMGSGKSSVGKALAKILGMQFIDTDEMIEKDVGLSINTIFSKKGEPFFRDVESKAIGLVSLLDNQVIATGGGVPLRKENMNELERNSIIIYLKVSPAVALERIGHDTDRPLLKTQDPLATAQHLVKTRETAYARCTHMIDTDTMAVPHIVERITELYKRAKDALT